MISNRKPSTRARALATATVLCILTTAALGAGTAQATQETEIEAVTLSELKLAKETFTVSATKPTSISVPGLKLTIECSSTEGSGSDSTGGTGEIKLTLSSCTVLAAPACKVKSIVLGAKTSLGLTKNVTYEDLEGAEEGNLGTVKFEGAECAFSPKNPLTGSFATEPPTEEFIEDPLKMSEAISKTANEELKAESKPELKLLFGKQAATMSGEPLMKLSGENAGKEWQVRGAGQLCMEQVVPCPAGKEYGAGTTLKIENEEAIKFEYGTGLTATCSTSKFIGSTNISSVITGTFTTATYEACGAGCTITVLNTPLQFRIMPLTPYANGGGTMKIRLTKLKIECNMKVCIYDIPMTDAVDPYFMTGGKPAKYTRNGITMNKVNMGSDDACAANGMMKGVAGGGTPMKYKFTEPIKVWFTRD